MFLFVKRAIWTPERGVDAQFCNAANTEIRVLCKWARASCSGTIRGAPEGAVLSHAYTPCFAHTKPHVFRAPQRHRLGRCRHNVRQASRLTREQHPLWPRVG